MYLQPFGEVELTLKHPDLLVEDAVGERGKSDLLLCRQVNLYKLQGHACRWGVLLCAYSR